MNAPSLNVVTFGAVGLTALVLLLGGRPSHHPRASSSPPPTPAFLHTQFIDRGQVVAEAHACQGCHSPPEGPPFAGARIASGLAPNITSDPISGIGSWAVEEVFSLLRTGSARGRSQAAGPMGMVVEGLADVSDEELRALVAWLSVRPPVRDRADTAVASRWGRAVDVEQAVRGASPDAVSKGGRIFAGSCASCHGRDGAGSADGYYPSLFHNGDVGRRDPSNLIATLLNGVDRTTAAGRAFMPSFDAAQEGVAAPLSDSDIAAVATFVRFTFGNPATPPITSEDVAANRAAREGG